MPRYGTGRQRRDYLIRRLRQADGPGYDDLVADLAARFLEKTAYWAGVQASRAVRGLLWDELAAVDAEGCVWLLPAGWQAAA